MALVLVPLVAGAGLAIDSALAFTVQERLQRSLDAAGLAAGNAADPAGAVRDAKAFFRANFDAASGLATAPDPDVRVSPDGTTITLSASATMPTRFMTLFGQDSVTVSAGVVINRQVRGLELALVLDVTGSMLEGGKIAGLRTAAKDLINLLYGNRETVPNLWVSIVPYVGMVNVGTANKSFLDASDPANESPSPFAPEAWGGCLLERAAPLDQTDASPGAAKFSSYLHKDRPESDFGGGHANHWGLGRPPKKDKKWSTKYKAYFHDGYGPNFLCPDPILPLQAQKSRLLETIDGLSTYEDIKGATHINVGLAWGWRTLSPAWRGWWGGSPAQLPLGYGAPNMDKFIVVLTDGENSFNHEKKGGGVVGPFTAYDAGEALLGIPDDPDDILTGVERDMEEKAKAELDKRTSAVCRAVRNSGISVYAITFGNTKKPARDLIQQCASNPANYFHSSDNSALRRAFREIGSQLSNLRVAR